VKKHASQEKRLDKAEQSKKAFIKQWLRSVSAANASTGRSDDDDEDGESAGCDEVVGSVDEEEGIGVDCCVEGSEVDVDVDVEDGVDGDGGDDAADEVVEVVLDKPRPPPPPLPIPPVTMPTTPIPAGLSHNATFNYNFNKRGNRYLNLRESGYTPAEEKMFLVSSLVLCGSANRPGRRRSSPAQSVLGSAADSSPPVDVIMIGSSDASGEASVIMEGERMDEEEDGEEDEEIQVVETWPWPTPAPTTPTTQGRTTTSGTVKQRSSYGSLSTRSNTGNTTTSAARRRALKRARLKNRIRILGGAKTGANGAPLALPPGEGVCGGTRTGVIMPRLRPGRQARPGA
jgi:hypothetical protein